MENPGMAKLIAVGVQYIAYVLVADDPTEALEVVNTAIRNVEDPLLPVDKHMLEVTGLRDIAVDWNDQAPWIAPSITDDDYAELAANGETTKAIFETMKKQ
jgi:hypothetical protein